MKRVLCVAAVAALAWIVSVPVLAQEPAAAPASDLNKSLQQFTVGDIFPKVVDASTAEIGNAWKTSAANLKKMAEDRQRTVASAIQSKKAGLAQTKDQLKAANKEKDFVKAGTLEGTIKNDEMVLKVLDALTKISQSQVSFATAWAAAGDSLVAMTKADEQFDPVRARGISKPEAGGTDNRMDASGAAALKAQSQAAANLGKAFQNLGSEINRVAQGRLTLLSQLEKSGQIQTAPPK